FHDRHIGECMYRRLLTSILVLLSLFTAFPGVLMVQGSTTPAGSSWATADVRTFETGEEEYVALSPDGTRIAGIGADGGSASGRWGTWPAPARSMSARYAPRASSGCRTAPLLPSRSTMS